MSFLDQLRENPETWVRSESAMSFLDQLRENPETWVSSMYGGFDPDLHTAGVATIRVEKSSHGRKRICRARLDVLRVPKKLKAMKAAMSMQETIHVALVEGQQLYPDEKATRQSLVAKGNDLIALAHVSGTAAAAFMRSRADTVTKLPFEWKRNKKKEGMHGRAIKLLQDEKVLVYLGGSYEDPRVPDDTFVKSVGSHAMDALCMALTEAGYAV
jgi:Holliday junction resolvasome RuvABC endonuclease subunit